MDISSFVVTVAQLFLIDKAITPGFDASRKKYVIPKYQREYKWPAEKVRTLISDINNRDKFIGNLILNKIPGSYEVVDGQQRITTILLALAALFNRYKSSDGELSEEQKNLLRYIYPGEGKSPVLENESVGQYIRLKGNDISLCIEESSDIYYQKETFEKIYEVIMDELKKIDDLMSFQKKILDCQILILVGDTRGRQNESIEEVFLDINFKSQLLDAADIFKGYCFKNYSANCHSELKGQWTTIRRYIKEFEKIGYDSNNKETCEYIYHYLLSKPDTFKIPSGLSYNGRHYLEGMSHTETKSLLKDMGDYGRHISEFLEKLSNDTYIFDDICFDAGMYATDSVNHRRIRKMFKTMILNPKVQYYKFPLFMVIHYLLMKEELKSWFSYENLKKFVTNYYVYSFLFISGKGNKNKTAIDQTIFTELYGIDSGSSPEDVIHGVLEAAKNLRRAYLEDYKQFTTFNAEKAYALYSLIDNYSAAKNYLTLLYDFPDYNKEHLIAHNNNALNITWKDDSEFVFSLKELIGKPNKKTYQATQYRSLTANYIVLPSGLNEDLGQADIVYKINKIREYYRRIEKDIPTHIDLFLGHIEKMPEYKKLSEMKGGKKARQDIEEAYKDFVNGYFSSEQQNSLYEAIERALKNAFVNRK